MINHEDQLKLQAYLDGELSEAEASEVANGLAQNQEAAALLTELRHTQSALAGFEGHIMLPESREFYWSKIQRQINAAQPPVDKGGGAGLFLLRFRRLLVPLTGVALVAVAALITLREFGPESVAVETSLADSGAMVYHDYSAGATFVWLSYPADNEMADNDDLDTFD